MNDDVFTPALLLCGIAGGSLLSYLELLWLKRPFQLDGSWRGLIVVALVNIAFFYLLAASQNSYIALFILPIPIIPAVYVLFKALAYFVFVQRGFPTPLHSPWKLIFLSILLHPAVFGLFFAGFININPTRANLEQAIRDKKNGLLELMLWMSVKFEPNMTILVNEAIVSGNDDAVRRLIRRGADPGGAYRLREGTSQTQWRITRWRLERGLTPADLDNDRDSRPFEEIAVGQGLAELSYCIKKGFQPARYPGVIQAAIDYQPMRQKGAIQPDEVQVINEKILLLLQHGADINGKDEMRFPAIYSLLLIDLDLSPVLTLMIEKGADVNARTPGKMYPEHSAELPQGLTPLMVAVIEKHPQYVMILLKSGADKSLRDAKGMTALDYARKLKADEATIQLLQ